MTNTIPKIVTFDCLTQKEKIRDMNEKELLHLNELKLKEAERQAEAEAKATAKAALLDRLGITADEAALLLA